VPVDDSGHLGFRESVFPDIGLAFAEKRRCKFRLLGEAAFLLLRAQPIKRGMAQRQLHIGGIRGKAAKARECRKGFERTLEHILVSNNVHREWETIEPAQYVVGPWRESLSQDSDGAVGRGAETGSHRFDDPIYGEG